MKKQTYKQLANDTELDIKEQEELKLQEYLRDDALEAMAMEK